MIPLRDVIPSRTRPVVTLTLIALNTAVFASELLLGERVSDLIFGFGLIAGDFMWAAVFTSMFLHGSLLHLAGNMVFLWIFGDNVEDRMGHGRFVAFYLLCGITAAMVHATLQADSFVPAIGTSGAIAGVMGAYFVLYPHSKIVTLMPIFVLHIVEVPAVAFLGVWLVIQLVSGLGALTEVAIDPGGGFSFWAQIATFAIGGAAILLFRRRERLRVEWWNDLGDVEEWKSGNVEK
jgi:membrane associated rhomboid family serine protease